MIQNIPEALHSPYGGFASACDDGTNRYATFVEVEGLPGVWPDGPHAAAIAHTARGVANLLRMESGAPLTDRQVALAVDHANTQFRMQDRGAAHQAAHYEDVLRGYLPAAREETIATYGALRAHEAQHGAPEAPSYEPGQLISAEQSSNAREAAYRRFFHRVGEEVIAERAGLSDAYAAARQRYESLCADLQLRPQKAEIDYRNGVDRTDEVQRTDRTFYEGSESPNA